MIRPLVPLGDFIERVGLRPAPDALHTYLQRLREHGFDVAATVDKVRGAGVRIAAEVAAITRLDGGEDRDAIGKVEKKGAVICCAQTGHAGGVGDAPGAERVVACRAARPV